MIRQVVCALLPFLAVGAADGDGLLYGSKQQVADNPGDNRVQHRCLTPEIPAATFIPLEREHPWSLPKQALAADFETTVRCLVLRFNFQYEDPDNPNTTGRGRMDFSPHPLPNEFNSATSEDSIEYLQRVGHFIDPPPHDSAYFNRHMRALRTYWETVSEDKITLDWDIFPLAGDSAYELPYAMNHYGRCDFDDVVEGLEQFFLDCIRLADTVHLLDTNHADIDFSAYDAILLFHAGSDRQNDVGFPPTCNDLFTGFIRFGDSVAVDGGAYFVRTALMVPETAVQDNRATALNAVLAHEFGHQLGLVDLYNTRNFFSQLGDFALMDNNGFGTGVDFGFPAGYAFGTTPLYPMAWSRAHLGLVPVVDFRRADSIQVVAAEVLSHGIKIARVPISETEYYLIENRNIDIDGLQAGSQFDTLTNVILGPARREPDNSIVLTGEYDFLMPGSGLLIFHVDEAVASLDYDGDGEPNFFDNDLQLDPDRKFITLVEADGLVNFGGYYRAGFGRAEDMFRDDRQNSFTPNTNPPAIDNSGNNTHVHVTDIRRAYDDSKPKDPYVDSIMLFRLRTDKLAENFPIRAGVPVKGLSPVADDLNGDGVDEILVASGKLLSAFTSSGDDFLELVDPCAACPTYYDTMITSINRRTSYQPLKGYPVPLYVEADQPITAGPVTGDFGVAAGDKYVAIGYPLDTFGLNFNVVLYGARDDDDDGQADGVDAITTVGRPMELSFGDRLYVLTDSGKVYRQDSLFFAPSNPTFELSDDVYYGVCRLGGRLVVLGGREAVTGVGAATTVHCLDDSVYSYLLPGSYIYGPVTVDVNRDGRPEIVAFSEDGDAVYLTVDTTNRAPSFSILKQKETGYRITVKPSIADVDLDGRPDVITAGPNAVYAFGGGLNLKTDFPIEIDDRFTDAEVITTVVVADIQRGGLPELILSTSAGNFYAYGQQLAAGFPLNSGEQARVYSDGAAVVFHDSTGGRLGYLGGDGWFYAWEVDADTVRNFWPMSGGTASGAFTFDQSLLPAEQTFAKSFPDERFYNYPNPVLDGRTTIRYFLGETPDRVTLNIYDLSGERIARFTGPTAGGTDNEVIWECDGVTGGVYRCVIEVDFGGQRRTAFTDIAIIR